jgi:hypothetical protein
MKKYALLTKLGEAITYVMADDKEEAVEKFSLQKKISSKDLLNIFIVKKVN